MPNAASEFSRIPVTDSSCYNPATLIQPIIFDSLPCLICRSCYPLKQKQPMMGIDRVTSHARHQHRLNLTRAALPVPAAIIIHDNNNTRIPSPALCIQMHASRYSLYVTINHYRPIATGIEAKQTGQALCQEYSCDAKNDPKVNRYTECDAFGECLRLETGRRA